MGITISCCFLVHFQLWLRLTLTTPKQIFIHLYFEAINLSNGPIPPSLVSISTLFYTLVASIVLLHVACFGEAMELLRQKLNQKNVYYMNPAFDI